MADEVASLLVRITADGSQAVGVLNGIQATVGTLADSNATMMNKIAASGALASKVGMTITKTVGVATVAGLTASAKAAGQLNKELANIGTLSVPTEKLKQYKGQIQDIAIATGKSTSDISEGTYQVVSAFGDAADTMEKVEINAKAAKAGLATTADSINLTSAVTKAYGDTSAAAVQKVADLAFKTVELGQTTFPELASSMQQVTSLSKELGVSQEELFASYATLTGVTGGAAEVQTQMKAIYTALLKPSENMTKAIKKQGYESGYSMIKTLGFAGTLDALKKATNGSEEEMLGLFNNVRAMPAVMALTGAQYDTFNTKLEKMKNAAGAASDAFDVQTEGIAKTGFTLEQAKVKMQVAAQRFGESAAPIIGDFADVVDKVSDKLANMSDEERRAIINTGVLTTKIGVGLAVGGKAVTIGTKIAGVAGALASAGPAAGIAAAGITGVAAAAVAGKVAYDAWYESNYKFADGLNEQAQAMSKTRKQWKALNDLRFEYNDLTEKINSNALEGEELEKAQARLEEIVQILKDKYEIDVDSGDIDEALEKAEELRKLTYQQNQHELKDQLDERRPAYDKAVNDRLPKAKKEYEEAAAAAEQYGEAQKKVQEAQNKFDLIKDSATAEERNNFRERIKDILSQTDIPQKLGENWSEQLFAGMNNSQSGAAALAELQRRLDGLNVDKLKEDYEGLDKQVKEYKNIASQYANTLVDDFEAAVKAGATDEDLGNYLRGIKSLVDDGLISMDEYAKKITLAKSGQESVNKVFEQGEDALKQYISSYTENMRLLGASDSDITAGLQPILDAYAKFMNLPEGKTFKINAEGNLEIVDEAKEKIEDLPEEHNIDINATDNTSDGVKSAKDNLDSIQDKTVTLSVKVNMPDMNSVSYGLDRLTKPKAQGTQNFEGGLAKVNDQKGITDPRELIIDRGRAFIPEGKDVILPLSKGAKVYTAAQTKAIMSGAGIPHYATGKNNSDALTKARDDWSHYTKTHAVTTAEELQKWLEFQEKYKQNEKDIWDIEEQVFSLRQKQFSEQTKASEAWLTHETKYNGLAVTEQLDAIDRIRKSVVAAYESGLISHQEYLDTIASYDEKYIDKRKEQIAEMYDISKAYISDRTFFNNWDEFGDDPIEAYRRVQNDRLNELRAGELTQKEYDEYMKELGSDMYSERREQSERWLEESRRYFNMNAEDYAKGIDRMKKYTQRYFDEGLINLREYNEAMTELNHMAWDEAESAYEEMLSNQSKYISEMRDKFSKQEQELRDSWTVEDRKTDMATVQKQLDLYSGAVTDRGQQKYKELQEQMKQLRRDEELYNLQVANNAVIESLESDYAKMESEKKATLAGIAKNTDIDVSGIIGTLTSNLDGMGGSIINLLQTLINTVDNKELSVTEGPTFIDKRRISLTKMAEILPYIGEMR